MLCKPDGLRCRGVNRISGEAEYRRSREWHGMPRKKRTGVRFVPGESATVSRQIDSLYPEERERDAGRMAVEPRARLYHGESATVSRQIDSLSPEGRERNAGRMAVEPRARLYHGKSATVSRKISSLSPKKTDVRLPDQYDREHSFVFRVSCCRAGIVYENCWSNRKSSNLHKTL